MHYDHSSIESRLFSLMALLCVSVIMLFAVARSGYGEDPQTLSANAAALNTADGPARRSAASADKPSFQPLTPPPAVIIARRLSIGPELSAHSYLVQFVDENEPILKSREWKRMKPASLTKMLTALIAEEELGPDTRIVFSEKAKQVEEKLSPAQPGDVFVRDDAIRLALVPSANDAATALAEAVGKKYGAFTFRDAMDVFVSRMNRKAQELGMNDSAFQNPTGLDDDEHYTTAADLVHLIRYAWKYHPELWEMSRQPVVQAMPMNGMTPYTMPSTDILLSEFPALLGGKTGLTDGAGQTLMLLYPVEERLDSSAGQKTAPRIAVIVLLGSDDRFGDGRKVIQWLEEQFK